MLSFIRVIGIFFLIFSGFSMSEEKLENQILNYMEFGKIPNLVIVTIDRSGNSDIKLLTDKDHVSTANDFTADSMFELASVSKAFTGMIAAQLIEEGVIDPSTKLSDLLPSIKTYIEREDADITFLDFLNHTSGMPFSTIDLLYSQANNNLSTVIDGMGMVELLFNPGTQHAYATINYDIAARMMEISSGRSYHQLLNHYILEPLEMNSTSIFADIEKKWLVIKSVI